MIKITLYVFLVISLYAPMLYGQIGDSFEQRYNEVYSAKIAENVDEAYLIADSLLRYSKNDEQRIKSYMLLANIKHSTGDISMAISHVLKAQRIAELGGYEEWEPRTAGFLATTFRNIGLLAESKKYLLRAETANHKLRNTKGYALTQAAILQEKAFHAMEVHLYDIAISILESAKLVVDLDTNHNSRGILVKATNNQLLAVCNLQLSRFALADSLLQAALIDLNGQESNLVPYIYRGFAELALSRGDMLAAKQQLELAEPYIVSANRTELKRLLYQTYIKYYDRVDVGLANHYRRLLMQLNDEEGLLTRKIANELLEKVQAERKQGELWSILLWTGIILLFISCAFMAIRLWLGRRGQQEQDSSSQVQVLQSQELPIAPSTASVEECSMHMAKDTEKRLVQRLHELEQEQFFLDASISLSKVAFLMNTNQRYVSYILKNVKHQDFNEYIQAHRIAYIKDRLVKDVQLLDCKISYIAGLCGFASHSKFLIAFRAETGMLPSNYIQILREKRDRMHV